MEGFIGNGGNNVIKKTTKCDIVIGLKKKNEMTMCKNGFFVVVSITRINKTTNVENKKICYIELNIEKDELSNDRKK